MDPCPVMMMTSIDGSLALSRRSRWRPSPSGRIRSTMARANSRVSMRSMAPTVLAAVSTSCPSRSRVRRRVSAMTVSSSTTRMRGFMNSSLAQADIFRLTQVTPRPRRREPSPGSARKARALTGRKRASNMRGMHFGVSLPGRGPLANPEALTKRAEKADALRYSSIFVTDHVVIPPTNNSTYPYSPTGRFATEWTNGYLEPIAMMGVLVGLTSRVKIGTSVLVVPYRNPVVTAKMLATLDVMSGGRLILGAGVGWMREEFEAVQAPAFEERGRSTDEYLRLMREMWKKEPAQFTRVHYRLPPVSAMPKPLQKGGIPIWIGGHTDAALRRTGELADAWHPI